jgi:hypothetical protein
MAFTLTHPSGYIANYSTDGTNITIPVASLESCAGANAANAAQVTEFLYGVLAAVADTYVPLATEDKSENMTISRSSTVPSDDVLRKTFTVSFNLSLPDLTVVDD